MPFSPGTSPWLKKYLLGALSQPPQLPSLHASYLLVITPVTARRTLCCYDGEHSVRVVLSQSVASTLDADEEDTGVTTRNLLGYVLAPVQVAVLTDMTTSPPSATLLLTQARLFSDRRHQRPAGILQNIDKDAQVIDALRANIGQELAALGAIPSQQNDFQTDADFIAAFENMEQGAPPFPPSDVLLKADTLGPNVEDSAAPESTHSKRTHCAPADDDDLALDAQDLELLEPDAPPLFSNTPTPQSARNSQGSRTVGLEKPPLTRKASQTREPLNSRNADLDQPLGLADMEHDPILPPSPPDGSGKQSSPHDLGRPLTQSHVEHDPIHDDGASTASKPSLDQQLEPRIVELAQRVVSETPEEDKDGNSTNFQNKRPHGNAGEESYAVLDGLSGDEMAGDDPLQLFSKHPNNHKRGRGKRSTKRDQGCRESSSEQQQPRDAMVTTRTTRATGKVLSSDKELEQEVAKQPEADDNSSVPEQETEQKAEKDDSSDQVERSKPAKDSAKDRDYKKVQAKVEKGDAESDGDEEQTAGKAEAKEAEGDDEEDEEKTEGVQKRPTAEGREEVTERPKANTTDVRVMVKDSDDEDEEEVEPVERDQNKDETKGDGVPKKAPETAFIPGDNQGAVVAKDDEEDSDVISPDPSKTDSVREQRTTTGSATTSAVPIDDDAKEADRAISKAASTKNGTKRKAGKSSAVERQTKRSRDDYYIEKLEAELKAIREFRMRVDRDPDMFALNPNSFLPGPIRRSVDRSLPSVPPPKLPIEGHLVPRSAPI